MWKYDSFWLMILDKIGERIVESESEKNWGIFLLETRCSWDRVIDSVTVCSWKWTWQASIDSWKTDNWIRKWIRNKRIIAPK